MTNNRKVGAGVAVTAIVAALVAAATGGGVDCTAHGRFDRASEAAAAEITCPTAACLASVRAAYLKTLELCK